MPTPSLVLVAHYGNPLVPYTRLHFQDQGAPTKLYLRSLSGAGITTWQVVLGRAVAGIGGAGMTSLVSILIAGRILFLPDKMTSLTLSV